MKKASKTVGILLLPGLLSLVVWAPLVFLLGGSLMGRWEISYRMGAVFLQQEGFATWSLLPWFPTLQPLVELLLDSPAFFVQFWNTVGIAVASVIGQLLIGCPAAWWFSRNQSKFSQGLFSFYTFLMLLPFQVTIVSHFLVNEALGLLDTLGSLVFPALFATLPVFILYHSFITIPEEVIEAAAVDGAGAWLTFYKVGVPLAKHGVVTALLLGFLEAWSLIEQPMVFIKEKRLWPLSLYLAEITVDNLGAALVASTVSLILPLLLLLVGQKPLEQGIASTGVKE